jgi:hypothetical protein
MAVRNTQNPAPEPEEVEAPEEAKEPARSLVVTGALAIVKGTDGKVKYLYRGAAVPDGVSSKEIDRLTELGLIGSK